MDPRTWAAFTLTDLLLSLTPGPAVLLVVSQGLQFGSRQSRRGALGILTANGFYFALSAAGLGALLLTSSTLFACVKCAGAAYLCAVGVRMLIRRRTTTTSDASDAPPPLRDRRLFPQGLITQLSNPKALVFFTALVPQFVSRGGSVLVQFAILGVSSMVVEVAVLLTYGWVAERGRQLAARSRLLPVADRVSGFVLVGTGVRIAVVREP